MFLDELSPGLIHKRFIEYNINGTEGSQPPHRALFQLSLSALLATNEYVTEMLNKGKIRPITSSYGATLFFIKQQDKRRGVIGYRALNRIMKRNNAPISRKNEIFNRLAKAAVFSEMDLKPGFHQIRVHNEHIEKTAFRTDYGNYEFLVMPMGLCNAPATLQELMNAILKEWIDKLMVVYLYYPLLYSSSYEKHLDHLGQVPSRLRNDELYVKNPNFSYWISRWSFEGFN